MDKTYYDIAPADSFIKTAMEWDPDLLMRVMRDGDMQVAIWVRRSWTVGEMVELGKRLRE